MGRRGCPLEDNPWCRGGARKGDSQGGNRGGGMSARPFASRKGRRGGRGYRGRTRSAPAGPSTRAPTASSTGDAGERRGCHFEAQRLTPGVPASLRPRLRGEDGAAFLEPRLPGRFNRAAHAARRQSVSAGTPKKKSARALLLVLSLPAATRVTASRRTYAPPSTTGLSDSINGRQFEPTSSST